MIDEDEELPFLEHLEELRTRLIRIVVGIIPTIAISWVYREALMEWLLWPLVQAWKARGLGVPEVVFRDLAEPFIAYMKIAVVSGLLLSSPWIFWQIWAFISPGLYRREKMLAIPFTLASTLCFVGGALFGYFAVFPIAFEAFLGFSGTLPQGSISIKPALMIKDHLGFSLKMLLAFGVVFEIPVVVTFLAAAGIVDWKQLLGFGRWWVAIAAVLSALLTPPDVGSQALMLGPLVGLYFLSVLVAMSFGTKQAREASSSSEHSTEEESR